ncbi:unnamed protein product [Caenorhabditis auriculariae]|uniref:Proteasome subunit alpha type-2 n=1 Tax=Caenorhabditis auriculariae TaxID=2777116 RepID=A0A8S1GZL9_9PELO|nr:unnamed protein product [Caenorhabditis auriculariae]
MASEDGAGQTGRVPAAIFIKRNCRFIMGDHYGFSLTTFSPSGKLMQIEYALNAVKNGQPSVGLRAKDGVVLATENMASVLHDDQAKIEQISKHIGCVYSGMGPDFRILVKKARKIAMEYELMYGEEMPTTQLVTQLAAVMQEYTQSGGVRPFGVSLLIAGWDKEPGRPLLFQSDPSGAYFAWKATALGKNDVNAKTFLEKRFSEALELDDGIHTALLTLRESFDVGMSEDNVEVAICNHTGFHRLTKQQVLLHFIMTTQPRFDWFQTESEVTLTILKRGAVLADCSVSYNERNLLVRHQDDVIFSGCLLHSVNSEEFTLSCTPSKVEVKMPKKTGVRWASLTETKKVEDFSTPATSKKNWDALVKEEEEEAAEGDEAITKMFQKIYKDSPDDVRRAMMKSYQESAGTVLSTNWAEIGKKKVEVQPPDCMEYKKF